MVNTDQQEVASPSKLNLIMVLTKFCYKEKNYNYDVQ